ncbi:MAG: permease prefix domain 1-containing protein [Desulfotomaculaceae bacterium]|nr:permease prefix domain 1-containing protein [Desulfotomaculaceae bacterium]MDD4766478.1 permease prefix domain 1-containing protein [Desulfotomaculaceae bacterium]
MARNDNPINKKIIAYIDNLFAGVGASQQLYDLKEELVTNLKEKIDDIKSLGLDDEQAFKEAVISMGDLSGLVDDMRRVGQDSAKQGVYSSMTTRISTAGIVAGVLLMLFGLYTAIMLYFMKEDVVPVIGSTIFIVAGGAILTYSILTRETHNKYGMNKIRALGYAVAVGLILFSIFTAFTTRFATGEMFIAIASLMVFSLPGIGLFLLLLLTGTSRSK